MNKRLAIYALAAKYRLSGAESVQLAQWAELEVPPPNLASILPRGLALLAACLFGFGLICYVAANWDLLGRFGQFALLQTTFLGLCLGAILSRAARVPLALLALLTIGGVFAYFGQTYQTGADPWTLFAIWGGLGLLLCVGVRSDVLWAPWALIMGTGIALWIQAHTGHQWRVQPADIQVYVIGWCASLSLIAVLNPVRTVLPGAGRWAFRTAVTLSCILIFTTAITTLLDYHDDLLLYWLALFLFAMAAVAMGAAQMFDIFGLSMVSLALNVLLMFGIGKVLLARAHSDFELRIFILGLLAAGLLALTVKVILYLSRHHSLQEVQS